MRNHPPLPSLAWNKINQCRLSLRFNTLLTFYALSLFGVQETKAAVKTWTGGAGSNNWTQSANWAPSSLVANDDLVFDGSTKLTNDNNTGTGTAYNSITFASGAGAFVLGGQQITLGGNVVNNAPTTVQTINLALALNGNRQFNSVGSSSVLQVNGIISGGFGIEKTGAGTLTLGGANSYTGSTTITSGTLLMGGSNVLPNSAVVLAGGTLSAPASGSNSDTTGALSMTASSVIDMGAGTNSLTFASLGSLIGTLSIWNWTGTANTINGTDQLNFTTGTANATFSNISFYSGAGSGLIGTGKMLADGGTFELVPVPEPGALFAGLALLAPLAWRERRHWMRCRDARVS